MQAVTIRKSLRQQAVVLHQGWLEVLLLNGNDCR